MPVTKIEEVHTSEDRSNQSREISHHLSSLKAFLGTVLDPFAEDEDNPMGLLDALEFEFNDREREFQKMKGRLAEATLGEGRYRDAHDNGVAKITGLMETVEKLRDELDQPGVVDELLNKVEEQNIELQKLRTSSICPVSANPNDTTPAFAVEDYVTSPGVSETAEQVMPGPHEPLDRLVSPLDEMDFHQLIAYRRAIVSHCQDARKVLIDINLFLESILTSKTTELLNMEEEAALELSKLTAIKEEEASKLNKLEAFAQNEGLNQAQQWQHRRLLQQYQLLMEERKIQQDLYTLKRTALKEAEAAIKRQIEESEQTLREVNTLLKFGDAPTAEPALDMTATFNETVRNSTETSANQTTNANNVETVHVDNNMLRLIPEHR